MVASQKVRTNIYLDQQTKTEAKELFKKFHISLSDAVNLFLSQSVLEQGLPFQVKIPNEETIKAMREVENGETETISLEDHLLEMKQCIKN
ncbi:MAG: type II toxin-antitoxin system RelB/DinJ family antitoxin [Campylobacterota bacterium]|nr:type II toxin-antitoxin system RelB/DinJ family antitoxin [Campylobacterota bacterium]